VEFSELELKEMDWRSVMRDGRWRWFSFIGDVVKNYEGKGRCDRQQINNNDEDVYRWYFLFRCMHDC
jgi:hypothetical protein